MSNHSDLDDPEMAARMRELFGEPQPMRLDTFSQGKLTKLDQGDFAFRVGDKDGKIVLEFHEPMKWVGMTPEQAVELAESLLKRAKICSFSRMVSLTIP